MPLMPDTKTHYWREAGLSAQVDQGEVRRARRELFVVIPLIVGVLVVFGLRDRLFAGNDLIVRVVAVVILAVLGWLLARAVGRVLRPTLFRRLDPGTAGTIGFLIRLATIGLAVLVSLRVAGLRPETLAVGGAVTAVVIGLAAQQTIGNVFAGMVLLSARPLRVGQRVRMRGSGHEIEGVVSSLGLLYTTLQSGEDTIMVPNNVVIMLTIVPLREPNAVDLRARLPLETKPSEVQEILEETVSVKTRRPPEIVLEEVDDDEVVIRISATPVVSSEGAKLADEVIAAMTRVHRDGGTATARRGPTVTEVSHPGDGADGDTSNGGA